MVINFEKIGRKGVGRWEYRASTAYVSEFAQTPSEGDSGRIETIKSLLWF